MKRSGCDEEDMIGFHGTILCHHRRSFYNGQDVALHTFARDICACTVSAADSNLVDLIQKYNTAILCSAHRLLGNDIHVDEFVCFLCCKDFAGLIDSNLTLSMTFRNELSDHGLQIITHAFKR